MSIDSHAHNHNHAYKKLFRQLTHNERGYALIEGDRERLLRGEQAFCSICFLDVGVLAVSNMWKMDHLLTEWIGR